MKYLVMECRQSYSVLLDEKGRFVRSANFRYEVGQTVENPALISDGAAVKRRPRYLWFGGVTVAAALLIIALTFLFRMPPPAYYANIYMKINPELRLEIDKNDHVIEIVPQNDAARSLLRDYNGTGKDKVKAANELIDLAVAQGYLSEGGQVYLAIEAPDKDSFRRYGFDLRSGVSEYRSSGPRIVLSIVDYNVTGSIRPDITVPTVTPAPSPTPIAEVTTTDAAPAITAALPETIIPVDQSKAVPADAGYSGAEYWDDDSGYDDSGYDDSGYDDSGYDD